MSSHNFRDKHQADVFKERLQSRLKRFNPEEYSLFVAKMINHIFNDRRFMARYPIHFLLHSIQSNALYHHKHRHDPVDLKALNKIMKHYTQYYDPIARQFLSDIDGVVPFFINMARQQFYLQQGFGVDSIGRSLMLFDAKYFKKSETYIKAKYGLTFSQWYYTGFALYAGLNNKELKILDKTYLSSLYGDHINETTTDSFFDIVSTDTEGIKAIQSEIITKVGELQGLFYDTYLQGAFNSKPLLRLNNGDYLAVHQELFMRKVIEGIFDICKKEIPSDFGIEFGKSFEQYVGLVLSRFLPGCTIINEKDVRRFTERKVCDYIVVLDECIYLIECKGVEYSAYIASENAIKNDNSTKKISTGHEQLTSAVKLLREGILIDLVGNIESKKIIASVITYKQLYLGNTQWYFDKVIAPNIKSKEVELDSFDIRPQILSIMELEKLLQFSKENAISIFDLFAEKVSKNEYIVGDWESYLKVEDFKSDFLVEKFNEFMDTLIRDVSEKE
ncbi:hypothetical protein HP548_12510 [Paenibacillus taichungensis]|uniref:NERD domain-containing protein n=1 Tax=Paenibacillus taichungensis TaxID=484184 RepID=A0ABX2MLJ4_9BACL|nr:hypothetical protein [Paenibacillus taichungensis]NUU54899.1 hypothetical protein [Paenibacillus taichungensis]